MSSALAVYHGPFGRASIYRIDRPLATHAHREGHLVFYVQGTPASMRVSGDVCPLGSDTGIAVNPWQPHSFHPGPGEGGTIVMLLYVNTMWFLEAGQGAGQPLRFGGTRIDLNPSVGRLVHVIASLMLEDAQSGLFDGHLYELTRICFEQTWQARSGRIAEGAEPIILRDYRVRNSIRLMQARLGDDVVIDQIARDAGLSRPHFYKLFRRHLGLTPNIYLNTLRMESAIERLTTTDEAVTSIGLDLGFASQASFTRFFTSNVGIPPTDYRRVAHLVA